MAKCLDLPLLKLSFRYGSGKVKFELKTMTLGGKQTPPRVEIIELREASLRLLARQTTARLRFLAAVGSLGAALLTGGTAALILGAALQALVAAAEFGVGHATGTPVFAAGEVGRTTVVGLIVSGECSGEQQAQNEERTSKHFSKHGIISSEYRVKKSVFTAQTLSAATRPKGRITTDEREMGRSSGSTTPHALENLQAGTKMGRIRRSRATWKRNVAQ